MLQLFVFDDVKKSEKPDRETPEPKGKSDCPHDTRIKLFLERCEAD